MIGFGNPLLDGPDHRYRKLAGLAREKQKCPETGSAQTAARSGLRGGGYFCEDRLEPLLRWRERLPETDQPSWSFAMRLPVHVWNRIQPE
jgi:hypothetical protein